MDEDRRVPRAAPEEPGAQAQTIAEPPSPVDVVALVADLQERLGRAEDRALAAERDAKKLAALVFDAEKDRDSWKRHCEMHVSAWTRELGDGPWNRRKAHQIDELVLSTAGMRGLAERTLAAERAWDVIRRLRAVWEVMTKDGAPARDPETLSLVVKFMNDVVSEAKP